MAQKFAFSEEIKSLFLGDFVKTSLWSELMKEFMGSHTDTEEMLTSESELQVRTG